MRNELYRSSFGSFIAKSDQQIRVLAWQPTFPQPYALPNGEACHVAIRIGGGSYECAFGAKRYKETHDHATVTVFLIVVCDERCGV